jgi:CBS domain-containing protein
LDRGVTTARNVVLCPDCRAENIEGDDVCVACGADLRDLKLPSATSDLEQHLISGHLGDLGAHKALNVSPKDPVALAVHFMREHNTECVLVRDKSGAIVGILTERDILMKAAGPNRDLMAMAVKDIMTPDPVMLREDDTLAVALHKMAVGGFRHIPFVDHDGTTLLFSIQDVFRHVAPYIPHK